MGKEKEMGRKVKLSSSKNLYKEINFTKIDSTFSSKMSPSDSTFSSKMSPSNSTPIDIIYDEVIYYDGGGVEGYGDD